MVFIFPCTYSYCHTGQWERNSKTAWESFLGGQNFLSWGFDFLASLAGLREPDKMSSETRLVFEGISVYAVTLISLETDPKNWL